MAMLLQSDAPYFLGRPRRFGKSLFLSTLKAYFEGKRELFEGLEISELEKDWTEYPVIYLDFNRENYVDLNALYVAMDTMLNISEEKYGITDIASTPSSRLSKLIRYTHETTGKKAVVLVDEYDKALVSTMDNPELNEQIRNEFKGFYGVLKAEDAHLRFVFLAGVTKFSKVSVFSDLNQLVDISLDKKYAGICGISETELLQNFIPEIQALAEENDLTYDAAFAEIKKRYDGYHFAKESEDIYNPFSVLNTFRARDFGNYWYETGTPTMLVKRIKEEQLDPRDFEGNIAITKSDIEDY
ncbi:MAG: AAA family ATPase, partial [Dysgonamonadaceae bacterium]|nr:AAA family ATPase [Dysgonamonadaceae bacterium]